MAPCFPNVCVLHSPFAGDELADLPVVSRRTPEFLSPEASQAEIARLNRVVMYLEARITRLTGNEAPSLTTPFRKDHVDQQPSPPSPPPPEPISAPTIPLCTTTSSYTFPVYPSPPPQLVPMPYQHPVAMPRQPTLLNPAMSYPSYGYDSYPSPATSTTSPEDFSFGALQAQYLEQGGAAIDWSLIAP